MGHIENLFFHFRELTLYIVSYWIGRFLKSVSFDLDDCSLIETNWDQFQIIFDLPCRQEMPVLPGNYLFSEGNRVAENSSGERKRFNSCLCLPM